MPRTQARQRFTEPKRSLAAVLRPADRRRSLRDRHGLRHLDTFAADPTAIGEGFDTHGARGVKGRAIGGVDVAGELEAPRRADLDEKQHHRPRARRRHRTEFGEVFGPDRKSTRLNSSHLVISYAVFCLKKKKK